MINLKNIDNMYKEYKIPKGNGKFREIQEPFQELKEEQSKILKELNSVKINRCAYGFVEKKDIYKNAKRHMKSNYILELDLKNFFDTIKAEDVYNALINNKFSKERAEYIAKVCTRYGTTPQGAPSSPILSNIVCKPLDRKLKNLSIRNKVIYTRYADDLTFSTKEEDGYNTLQDLKKEAQSIINSYGFDINGSKTHTLCKSRRHSVTGIVVNEKMNVSSKDVRAFRAKLHNIFMDIKDKALVTEKELEAKYNSINELRGYANFIYQANPEKNIKYLNQVKKIQKILSSDASG